MLYRYFHNIRVGAVIHLLADPTWRTFSLLNRLTLIIFAFAAAATTLSASTITLSGATTYSVDADGNWTGLITSSPRSDGLCCQLSVLEPDIFNDGAGAVTMPSYLLNPGSYTLYLETSNWSSEGGLYAVNLFFDGDYASPKISAFVTATGDKTDFTQSFQANSSTDTANMFNNGVAGSGALSFTNVSGTTVTLTGLQWVAGGGSNPYNGSMTVVRLDLDVSGGTGIPEPETLPLMGSALLAVGFLRRRFLIGRG